MNLEILKQLGFGKEVNNINKGLCPFCNKPVTLDDFKDELSKKEFKLSGMCQNCMDKIFKE